MQNASLPMFDSLPVGWEVVPFGSVLIDGVRNGIYKPAEYHGVGANVVNMGELFAYHRLNCVPMQRVNVTADELLRFGVEPGDLLFARRSLVAAGAGKCSIICALTEPAVFESSIIRARPDPDRADSLFLYYLFNSPFGRYSLQTILRQVAVSGITGSDLVNLAIPLPPRDYQRAIGRFLGALDDKIDLNRRTNETLESIARAIFKSWFVDFDPVRAKAEGRKPAGMDAETAALFPGNWQNSPAGVVPSGWTSGRISDRTSRIQYGLTQSASAVPIGPKFLRITDIQGGRVDWSLVPFCSASPDEHEKYRICPGDILVARTGASTGENMYIVNAPDAVFASYLVRLQFETRSLARLVAEFMRTDGYFSYIKGVVGGSAQPNASGPVLAGAEVVFPTLAIADAFLAIADPLDRARFVHQEEANTLAQIRDALLPKLLSGEVRIRDAENALEADA